MSADSESLAGGDIAATLQLGTGDNAGEKRTERTGRGITPESS
jgi:hypothetical protein